MESDLVRREDASEEVLPPGHSPPDLRGGEGRVEEVPDLGLLKEPAEREGRGWLGLGLGRGERLVRVRERGVGA